MGQRAIDLLTFHFGPGGSGHFGSGATAIEALERGALGDGNSVHWSNGPDEGALVKSGHVSRALRRCSDIGNRVLAAAYGDAGFAATERGTCESRRWFVVAPLTDEARRRAEVWRAQGKAPGFGFLPLQWWQAKETRGDALAQKALERAATALLAACMAEFMAALTGLEAGQRAIAETNMRALGCPKRVPEAALWLARGCIAR